MADEIRIVFPESSGLADLVLPLAAVEIDPRLYGAEDAEIKTEQVKVGEWAMEHDVLPDGTPAANQEETDADPAFIQGALAAWATWLLWLHQQGHAVE